MSDMFQFLIQLPDGWRLFAIFRDLSACNGVAELVRMAWAVNATCVLMPAE